LPFSYVNERAIDHDVQIKSGLLTFRFEQHLYGGTNGICKVQRYAFDMS